MSILLHIVTFLVDKIMVAREKMHTNNGGGAGRFSFPGQEHIAAGPSELVGGAEGGIPPPPDFGKKPSLSKGIGLSREN